MLILSIGSSLNTGLKPTNSCYLCSVSYPVAEFGQPLSVSVLLNMPRICSSAWSHHMAVGAAGMLTPPSMQSEGFGCQKSGQSTKQRCFAPAAPCMAFPSILSKPLCFGRGSLSANGKLTSESVHTRNQQCRGRKQGFILPLLF